MVIIDFSDTKKQAEHRRKIETMAIDANIATLQNQLALGEKQQKSVFRSDLIGQVSV